MPMVVLGIPRPANGLPPIHGLIHSAPRAWRGPCQGLMVVGRRLLREQQQHWGYMAIVCAIVVVSPVGQLHLDGRARHGGWWYSVHGAVHLTEQEPKGVAKETPCHHDLPCCPHCRRLDIGYTLVEWRFLDSFP